MIHASLAWIREQAGPLSLALVLHIVLGALLILGTSLHGARSNDAPGRGNEHQPIQAVVVNQADYKAAEAAVKQAQNAKLERVRRLQAEAAAARKARARVEQQLTQLKRQKQSTANDVSSVSKQLASQSQELRKLKAQAAQVAAQRKRYAEKIAKLKAEAAKAQKAQAAEKARLAKVRQAAEAARKAQLEAQMQAEQEQRVRKEQGNWMAAIRQRVIQSWIRPPSVQPGLDCYVKITLLPSGQVVHAKMGQCNGNAVIQQSIITAVLKASPLPIPQDPQAFSRNITFEFAPEQ